MVQTFLCLGFSIYTDVKPNEEGSALVRNKVMSLTGIDEDSSVGGVDVSEAAATV